MNWLNRKDNKQVTNQYGVIKVLFHTDCNLVGEHGMVLVSNRKLGIQNAAVSFFLKDCATAPAFTPRLFLDLEAAAESQGYVLHELISYVRLEPSTQAVQKYVEALGDRRQAALPVDIYGDASANGYRHIPEIGDAVRAVGYKNPLDQASTFGSVRHNEVSGEAGATLMHRAQTIPRTEHREPFDVRSLNANAGFGHLNVPAFMRKGTEADPSVKPAHPALARMDAQIAALVEKDTRAWVLSPDSVSKFLSYLSEEQREELKSAALLLAAKKISDPAKHEELCTELAALADRYVEMPDVAK